MANNTCVCCGEIIPEGYLVCPACIRKNASPEEVSTPFLGLAHREHDRYLETKRERNDALIERRLAQKELDALRRRLRTCEAAQVFPPNVDARADIEKKIAHTLGEFLLTTGMIQFTEDTDTYEDRSLTVLFGRVVILQPRTENESGRPNEVT